MYSIIIQISFNIHIVATVRQAGIQNGYELFTQLINMNYANGGQKGIHCVCKILHKNRYNLPNQFFILENLKM
jgi:hypothetical protein